jgi:hypothetical protein
MTKFDYSTVAFDTTALLVGSRPEKEVSNGLSGELKLRVF